MESMGGGGGRVWAVTDVFLVNGEVKIKRSTQFLIEVMKDKEDFKTKVGLFGWLSHCMIMGKMTTIKQL